VPLGSITMDVTAAIERQLQDHASFSINPAGAHTPALASIWNELGPLLERKTGRSQPSASNRVLSIEAEICHGRYDRLYQLTSLSPATAACLVMWPGKELYLNGIDRLTPEAAAVLSRWPGEWLSINGVKELSAETAAQLARWQGRHLSLNGLTALSPEAAGRLSGWRGEQLEMVGLRSLRHWPDSGARLFLSEDLRRKREAVR
jgi:hypothetical protein